VLWNLDLGQESARHHVLVLANAVLALASALLVLAVGCRARDLCPPLGGRHTRPRGRHVVHSLMMAALT
jgi:hypothetical protein